MREYTCQDCGNMGVQPGRGRARVRCSLCAELHGKKNRAGVVRHCITCGTKIKQGSRKTFCSLECRPGRVPDKACVHCGTLFAPERSTTRFCSISCSAASTTGFGARSPREIGCMLCESPVTTTASVTLCEPCRKIRKLDSWRRKNWSRRARLRSVASDNYTLSEIAERDEHVCQLCFTQVDMTIPAPDRMSATVDHVVPLVAGGDDTRANVQLAHRGCNSSKGGCTLLVAAV